MSTWPDHCIWWHVYPLGFTGAEKEALGPGSDPKPRLRQFGAWLDYLLELGCNGLALGPVFDSETHGYDTIDHRRVDPRLGTEDDLHWLIEECHAHGIRVLLDGVFNHVGRGFEPFQRLLAEGPSSEASRWFHVHPDPQRPDGFRYDDFEGHQHLVKLRHSEPDVRRYVIDVMSYWLDRGVDGWRLDAAYAVPLDFWAEVAAAVHDRHPEAWLVGEVIHAPYEPWVTDGGLDSVTQYELWKSIWSSLNDRNFYELSWTLERHGNCSRLFLPSTFVGNHDVTRIATRLDDDRHVGHAAAVLLTLPGAPSIYAGDEQGFTGTKSEDLRGDDAVRPPFPQDPSELLPYGWPTYRLWQDLVSLRRRHDWLSRATVTVHDLANETLSYVCEDEGNRVAVLLNVSDEPATFPEAEKLGTGFEQAYASGDASAGRWGVGPHAFAILASTR